MNWEEVEAYYPIRTCPWAMCDIYAEDHSYCARLFAGRVNDFTNDKFVISIDPVTQFEEYMDFMENWRQDHPMDTMMDNGTRIYNWRAIRKDSGEWEIQVGY